MSLAIPTGFHGESDTGTHIGLKLTDGDTIQINQPIRMLNIDTPEKSGGSFGKAESAQKKINRAKKRMEDSLFDGLLEGGLMAYLTGKATIDAASRHFRAGKSATKALSKAMRERLGSFSDDLQPKLFISAFQPYFDRYLRVLAFVSPFYTKEELPPFGDPRRRTYNLEMLENGHACHFPIYPSIPKPQDWLLAVNASKNAWDNKLGQWSADNGGENVLLAYEFRAMLDLGEPLLKARRGSSKKEWFEDDIANGMAERAGLEADGWRFKENTYESMVAEAFSRHCIDISTWTHKGVQSFHEVEPWARLWVWSDDVTEAKAQLGVA